MYLQLLDKSHRQDMPSKRNSGTVEAVYIVTLIQFRVVEMECCVLGYCYKPWQQRTTHGSDIFLSSFTSPEAEKEIRSLLNTPKTNISAFAFIQAVQAHLQGSLYSTFSSIVRVPDRPSTQQLNFATPDYF
jgi:hypothetical protein